MSQSKLLTVGSLVAGVCGIALFWWYAAGGVLGLGAIVLAYLGLSASGRPADPQRALAAGGVVSGAIALGLTLGLIVFGAVVDSAMDDVFAGVETELPGGLNSDPADGVCDRDRWLQDPDC